MKAGQGFVERLVEPGCFGAFNPYNTDDGNTGGLMLTEPDMGLLEGFWLIGNCLAGDAAEFYALADSAGLGWLVVKVLELHARLLLDFD